MSEPRAKGLLTRDARVALSILAIVAFGGSVYGWAVGPTGIEPSRLGCEASDAQGGAAPPRGRVGDGPSLAPRLTWAEDVIYDDIPPGSLPIAVAAVDARAVAVGRIDGGGGTSLPLVATTVDGRRWQLAEFVDPTARDDDLVDVAAGGPGWIAVGSGRTDDRGGRVGVVLWSRDGTRWQRLAIEAPAYIHKVAVGADGVLALGAARDGTALVGSSPDGMSWTWREDGSRRRSLQAIAWANGEWLAGGGLQLARDDLVPAIWRSADGVTWACRLLPTGSDHRSFGVATSVLPGAATTLVLGHLAPHCASSLSCPAWSTGWLRTADGRWTLVPPDDAPPGPVTLAADGSFVRIDWRGVHASAAGDGWRQIADSHPAEAAAAIAALGSEIVAVGTTAGVAPWFGRLIAAP